MKILANRKASEMWAPDTIIWWIIFGIALGFAAVFFVVTVSKIGFQQAKINENIESLFLMQRFLSPNCFAYSSNGVVLKGTIDYSKFTQDKLDGCYAISETSLPAFRLNLKSVQAGIDSTIQTKNWNKNRSFEKKEAAKSIAVYSQGLSYKGELTIEIQNLQ